MGILQRTAWGWAVIACLGSAVSAVRAEEPAAAKQKQEALKKAVAGAYKPLFFDNQFAYVESPLYQQDLFGDALKRNSPVDGLTYDIGGQFRMRQHAERNMRGLGLTGRDDDFLLYRTRLFANVEAGEFVRVYAEMIDALSRYEDFAPRSIEENRADLLNLFADVSLLDADPGLLKLRAGRQELLYGSERLVSPLDWANTRRTFEGYKLMWAGDRWNVDAFYTRPVLVNPAAFDSADYRQEFAGIWSTYKAIPDQTIDLYFLNYWNNRGTSGPPAAPVQNNFVYRTTGVRWLKSKGDLLYEFEGGVQYGNDNDDSGHFAGFFTSGLGHQFADHAWKPTLWAYYDFASGSNARAQGQGMNHLFPLAHKYLGFMDLFGRSNIQSPNMQLTFQPHERVKVLAWYYYLMLQNGNDTPYNVNMAAFNGNNAPGSKELGHEIDLTLNYSLTSRMDLLFGYSHFFAGRYYKTTAGVPFQGDADFFYTQYQWNF